MQNPFSKDTEETIIKGVTEVHVVEEVAKEPVEVPKVAEVKVVGLPKKTSNGFDTRKNQILKQYGGLESNIPITSAYWKM